MSVEELSERTEGAETCDLSTCEIGPQEMLTECFSRSCVSTLVILHLPVEFDIKDLLFSFNELFTETETGGEKEKGGQILHLYYESSSRRKNSGTPSFDMQFLPSITVVFFGPKDYCGNSSKLSGLVDGRSKN